MNDNQARYEAIAQAQNVAANGRWGVLGMAAVALHQGFAFLAFGFVLCLFLAWVTEQLPARSQVRAVMLGLLITTTIGNCFVLAVLLVL